MNRSTTPTPTTTTAAATAAAATATAAVPSNNNNNNNGAVAALVQQLEDKLQLGMTAFSQQQRHDEAHRAHQSALERLISWFLEDECEAVRTHSVRLQQYK
jgi:hypothetical protein